MGQVKRWLEEIEARGWSQVDKTVCTQCLTDYALVEAVRAFAGTTTCDYCGSPPARSGASAPVSLLVDLIVGSLRCEYEDPVEQVLWSSADGGYQMPCVDTYEVLEAHEVTENGDLLDDLTAAIGQTEWVQRDPYKVAPTDALRYGWSEFRDHVKHRRRYSFLLQGPTPHQSPGEITINDVPAAVLRAVAEADQVRTLLAGTRWWRLRPHAPAETYVSAKDLGTPPDHVARDNRMSGKGIGAFYGASTALGAQREVASYADPSHVGTIGQFELLCDITVVDLTNAPRVPSLFDSSERHRRPSMRFMQDFVEDVRRVADPDDRLDLDYVPTQIISEFLRYELNHRTGPVLGVLWRSSKDPSIDCCVIFASHEEMTDLPLVDSAHVLGLDPGSVRVLSAPLTTGL
ncbi:MULTISPECIES: HEPN-associated N-terminal domain-containing protein [Kocuria]|uniref:HEPN-associated N-terminal domain-containing protein n=1 Tax=Kocuria TaxID=57493 RepID=UPI001EF4408F|nr:MULTISPECIES: HEPN-associated N-terminal domain-containing protein [Kocuria]MCG7424808.1 HEPN-associated N-terminal domain-containing protein [Kocuria rhizophila]MCT1544528.1 HEPN-associated N-terminal domain-containing protein [Kocuria rhizophila]MCT2170820.1 HEPN-associated N-terminal domain-containing protein [Kocuria rhizophila]MCT2249264.1 HEPN-associated N-terminal domain-containing protein [Kocuria rhizophila]MDA4828623.1 HEPN-associated N-terminal domain-containing protein [Kocuria 